VREQIAIPVWEQTLSAVRMYDHGDRRARDGLRRQLDHGMVRLSSQSLERIGLKPTERIAGFIYIGHPVEPLEDRARPPLEAITTRF